jgi:hypothetical protein
MVSFGEGCERKENTLFDVDLILYTGEVGREEVLRPRAVWTVGLGEYDDLVAGNGIFDGLFSGHACSRRGRCETGEERANRPIIYASEHSTG